MSYLAKTTSKGHDYYKIMESYREEGKTKHRVVFNIGSLKNLFALLPEDLKGGSSGSTTTERQDKIQVDVSVNPVRCRKHGATHLLSTVAEWLSVTELMDSIFPPKIANSVKRSTSLLLAAIHRACEPGSKREFAEWFSHTSLPDYMHVPPEIFTSQHMWEQMDGIDVDDIKKFESALFQRILLQFPEIKDGMDSLSADFTNYFTYISSQNFQCSLAQLGHSKEGRSGQKIVNVAVVTSSLLGIPIATMVYEGNHNDKTALRDFLNELNERLKDIISLDKITFVFDGGGTTEDALGLIPGHFITRGSLKSSPELYEIPLSSYEEMTLDGGKVVQSYRTMAEQYGKQRTVIVTLSEQLRLGQVSELDKRLKKFGEQVAEVNSRLGNPRSTTDKRLEAIQERINQFMLPQYHFEEMIRMDYQTVEAPDPILLKKYNKEKKKQKIGEAVVIDDVDIKSIDDIPLIQMVTAINYVVLEEKKKSVVDTYYGKHLLVTDLDDWDTVKILNVYRDQEFVERFFRDSKDVDHFSVRPIYHWTDQKIRVHIMICYLGLTLSKLATYVLRREQNYRITCPELLDRLNNVLECLVIVDVNGGKMQPIKTLNQLEDVDLEVWQATEELMRYIRENPFVVG